MALVLSESFTGGIPGGFASTVLGTGGAGALTATYNSGQQAVHLVKGGLNGAWVLDAAGYQSDLRVVLDIEQMSADNGESSASGLGLSFRALGEDYHRVVAIFPESGVIASYRGNSAGPIDFVAVDGGTSPIVPPLAGRRTVEFRVVRTIGGADRQVQVYVDGTPAFIGTVSSINAGAPLLPGIFLRDCSYRLHSVEVYSDAALFLPTGRALLTVGARLALGATAGQGHCVGGMARYDPVDGGPFRVAGTVKIDGTPATPVARRVRLFDTISGRLVRQVWSGTDGAFAFERIRAGEYLVVSDDHTRTYNAVAADRVAAVP